MTQNKKKDPLVSVILACYNHQEYVSEAIESILRQTYSNIELIVIDDGSQDDSVHLINKLLLSYKFTFIHRENKGITPTLNEGLKIASGKYISLCASDDKYHINKIRKQVDYLEINNEYAMCFSKMFEFDENIFRKVEIKQYPNEDNLFNLIFLRKLAIPTLSVLIRKEIFDDVGLFDENLYFEDWDMWLRISDRHKIGFIDEYLVFHRLHESNITKNTKKIEESTNLIFKKWMHKPFYNKALVESKLRFFKSYATYDKLAAFKRLIKLLPYFYKKIFLSAVIRLLTPKQIYNFAKKLYYQK